MTTTLLKLIYSYCKVSDSVNYQENEKEK